MATFTRKRELIGKEDFSLGNATFTRSTSTGGSQTLTQLSSIVAAGVLVFNVKDSGAKGDGITDDTTAIQAAQTAAAAGGAVYFPPGTYLFSSTLSVASSTHLIGAGKASTILSYSGSAAAISFAAGIQKASIEGLTLLLGTSLTAIGVNFAGSGTNACTRNYARALQIQSDANAAIYSGQIGIKIQGVAAALSTFHHIEDVHFIGIDQPIVLNDGFSNQNKFVNITIEKFGSGSLGKGINSIGAANNTFAGVTFSRGGSVATDLLGIGESGLANVYVGVSADIGSGQLCQLAAAANSIVVVGTDTSNGLSGGTAYDISTTQTNMVIINGTIRQHMAVASMANSGSLPANIASGAVVSSVTGISSGQPVGRFYAEGNNQADIFLKHINAGLNQKFMQFLYNGGTFTVRDLTDAVGLQNNILVRDTSGNVFLGSSGQSGVVVSFGDVNLKQNSGGTQAVKLTGTPTAVRTWTFPDVSAITLGSVTTGVGNGASQNLTALAKSTGSGPASDAVVTWSQINIGGVTYWIPLFQ